MPSSEVVSDALQVLISLWLWFLSLTVLLPAIGHPMWTAEHPDQTSYWIQELSSQNTNAKDQKVKLSGMRFGIRQH